MDVEELLAPVSEESPTGADLSYEASRQEIEQFFERGDGEDGDAVDWRDAVQKILAENKQTKDVWLAVYLMRAGANLGDLDAVVSGAQMLAGLLERYWDSVHPSIEEYGFLGRKGPCESLTTIPQFLRPLRRIRIIEHPRLGTFTGEDLERFAREGDGAEGFGMFKAASQEASQEELQAKVDSLDHLREAIRRIDAALMENAGDDGGTNFQPTYEAIEELRQAIIPLAGIESQSPEAPETEAAANSAPAEGPKIAGRVDSREDVIRALEAIAEYYSRREPGSPIPVALRRIGKWVNMDFMAVLADIAPNSVSEAGQVLLTRPAENSSDY
jgi:type VI secretion system protein ImpA